MLSRNMYTDKYLFNACQNILKMTKMNFITKK